jgi:hypothetical protein
MSTRDMSDPHERFLAELIGGYVTPGSGSHPANQADTRGDARRQPYAFALDGKSTKHKSITIRLADWNKIWDQSHDELPGLGLRFYLDDSLKHTVDLIVLDANTFAQILVDARFYQERWAR